MAGSEPFCCQSGEGTDVLPKGWGLHCLSPASSPPCAWDQPARVCRSGFRTSLCKHAEPSRKGSHTAPAPGGTREQSPLLGPAGLHTTPRASSPPSPLLTAVASAGHWGPLSWVLTEAPGPVQCSVTTVKTIWASQSQSILT